jgi:catechol 2,3-dioxygenase-like lactoylglutathione lyase family enzyme
MTDVILDQINLVCANLDDSIAFYRALGLAIPEDTIWRTHSGAHHVDIKMENGFELALDSQALAQQYNQGSPDISAARKSNVISFRIKTPEEVDASYTNLIDLGYISSQIPYNTFWGSRYAIIEDPDGNLVGLMSPPNPDLRTGPPDI